MKRPNICENVLSSNRKRKKKQKYSGGIRICVVAKVRRSHFWLVLFISVIRIQKTPGISLFENHQRTLNLIIGGHW